jgi:hypothetical protein
MSLIDPLFPNVLTVVSGVKNKKFIWSQDTGFLLLAVNSTTTSINLDKKNGSEK